MLVSKRKIWTPDNSFLLEYRERIESGEIIAGQELRMELSNLTEDFHNEEYIYDTEDAMLRMDFMEDCVRLTKSPYYNKPMVLMLWQKAFIEAVYSFKMARESKDMDLMIRRFKKILLLIARKNTKSETCSALALSEFICGNEGADLVCASNDDSQSSITYDAIDTMRKLIDPADLDTKRNQSFILNKESNTKIFKLSDRTRNKEGRNIDFAILDEIHEMKDNTIAMSIEQSQSLKDNPLFIEITTEGFIQDGYLDDELRTARKIIKGEDDTKAGQRFLPWLYTQDSEREIFQNPASWIKSNPTIGIVKKKSYLEEQIDKARESKADRIFVLSKDFNIKQNSVEAWLNLEDYDYEAVYDLEEFRGAFCLGAVDLSETTDLTCAKILMMKQGDRTKYIYTMYFIPESKLLDSDDKSAGAKYEEWAKDGFVTITEGNDIDLAVVADFFVDINTSYGIKLIRLGYDQRYARAFINRMEEYGWTREAEELVMILQNAATLNNAIRLVEAELKARLVNYNQNPVDKWCLGNAGIEIDNKRQCLCVKMEERKRIDGAVTLIILYEMYRRYRTEFEDAIKKFRGE